MAWYKCGQRQVYKCVWVYGYVLKRRVYLGRQVCGFVKVLGETEVGEGDVAAWGEGETNEGKERVWG